MIGIVIPACNEEQYLTACLNAVRRAIDYVHLHHDIQTLIEPLVVLDACVDRSLAIVQSMNFPYLQCNARKVGVTRDLGVRHLIDKGATWIACSDADSCVHENWLFEQIKLQPVDVVCGVVEIADWGNLSVDVRTRYLDHYQDCMGHRHVHGANLSFSAEVYLNAGGFDAVTCHEDVRLVERLKSLNCDIAWSNQVRVTTSSRLDARAPEGFSNFLSQLEFEQTHPELSPKDFG